MMDAQGLSDEARVGAESGGSPGITMARGAETVYIGSDPGRSTAGGG